MGERKNDEFIKTQLQLFFVAFSVLINTSRLWWWQGKNPYVGWNIMDCAIATEISNLIQTKVSETTENLFETQWFLSILMLLLCFRTHEWAMVVEGHKSLCGL